MATLQDGFLVGFDADMDEATYFGDPCPAPSLSSHIAKLLVSKSPAHARAAHPRLGGSKPETSAKHLDFGSTVHALVLGRGREVVRIDADNWRTKDARAKRDVFRAQGKIPVLNHEAAALIAAAKSITLKLRDRGIVLDGASELSVFWTETADDGTVVQCKGRIDHWLAGEGRIYDLKSAHTAHPRSIPKHVDGYGYDIQCEAYRRAVEASIPELAGRVGYRWIFAELEEPFPVVVAEPTGSFRALGASRWRRAVNLWARCMRTGEWPAYLDGEVLQVEAPPWAMGDEMAAGFSGEIPFGDDDKEGEAA